MKKEFEIFKMSLLAISFTILFVTLISFGMNSFGKFILFLIIIISIILLVVYLITMIKEIENIFEKFIK
jgi:hypothetical protein